MVDDVIPAEMNARALDDGVVATDGVAAFDKNTSSR